MLDTWEDVDAVPVVPYYPVGEIRYGPGVRESGARSTLRTGDQLVCVGEAREWWQVVKHPLWKGIQKGTGHLATHVGFLAYWKEADQWLVVEALGGKKVEYVPLSFYIPGLDDGKKHVKVQRSHMFVMRPHWPLCAYGDGYDPSTAYDESRHLCATKALNYAVRKYGIDYPTRSLVRIAMMKVFGFARKITNPVFCSHLCAESLRAGGVEVERDLFRKTLSSPGAVANACEMVGCLWHPER